MMPTAIAIAMQPMSIKTHEHLPRGKAGAG
jgi:hypothetical protein